MIHLLDGVSVLSFQSQCLMILDINVQGKNSKQCMMLNSHFISNIYKYDLGNNHAWKV